ncbi:MAG: ATPase, T2SS/T4P/T4SS family, partial [Gemmatimonadales bacterium]
LPLVIGPGRAVQGVVQVQVHEKAGLTFAAALRSILRQDPDIVLVGEIRDKETANIAIQASLTGHLVLSTLHTNDAPGAVTRLIDVGVEGHKIGTALRGIVAQRLMRRLCSTCKEPWVEEVPSKLQDWIPTDTPLFRSVGCPECAMTGYRGRFSIVEVLKMTQEIEKLIVRNQPADRIAEAARNAGMKSLWESGLAHVLRGESTIDELLRVVEVPGEYDFGDGDTSPIASDVAETIVQGQALNQDALQEAVAEVAGVTQQNVAPPPVEVTAPQPQHRKSLADEFELIEHGDGTVTGADGAAISVLLVDDEDQLRRVMRDLLERDGYTIFEATDGIEALDQVDRHAPDVIVLDLSLPNLDGYGVLNKLKAKPATAGIPVIVLTANRDEDNEVRVFEHGATDFLSKPFRARALSARLRAVLGRAKTN